jgi:hypothetical protein
VFFGRKPAGAAKKQNKGWRQKPFSTKKRRSAARKDPLINPYFKHPKSRVLPGAAFFPRKSSTGLARLLNHPAPPRPRQNQDTDSRNARQISDSLDALIACSLSKLFACFGGAGVLNYAINLAFVCCVHVPVTAREENQRFLLESLNDRNFKLSRLVQIIT